MRNKTVFTIEKNGLHGLVDTDMNYICNPIYKYIDKFILDRAIVIVADSSRADKRVFSYVDKNGKLINNIFYDVARQFNNPGYASCAVGGKYGFIDINGNTIIPHQYESCSDDFDSNGIAIVSTNNKFGLINAHNQIICDFKFEKIRRAGEEVPIYSIKQAVNAMINGPYETEKVEKYYLAKQSGKWGTIDINGNWIIEAIYDSIESIYGENIIKIMQNDKWGLAETNGKIIFKPDFDYIYLFNGDFAQVDLNGKSGLIDKTGKLLVSPIYDCLNVYAINKLYISRVDWQYGIVDIDGNCIFEPYFDLIIACPDMYGLAIAKKNDKYGYINSVGKWVCEPIYDYCDEINEAGFGIVGYNGKHGVINIDMKIVANPIYEKIFLIEDSMDDTIAIAKLDNAIGFITKSGLFSQKLIADLIEDSLDGSIYHIRVGCMFGLLDKSLSWIVKPQQYKIYSDVSYRNYVYKTWKKDEEYTNGY